MSAGGLFIAFEGGEGAGKSTQVHALAHRLTTAGRKVTVTREPGTTPLGGALRGLLLDAQPGGVPPKAEALLYAADRANHVSAVIRPALAAGHIVITDRYEDSSIAYQGHARMLGADEVAWLSRWASDDLHPDVVILLDLDPNIGLARVRRRGPGDRIEAETVEFHQRVRAGFQTLVLANPSRYLVLDATAPAGEIAAAVHTHVTGLLDTRPTSTCEGASV